MALLALSTGDAAALVVAVALLVYLIYALLRAEQF